MPQATKTELQDLLTRIQSTIKLRKITVALALVLVAGFLIWGIVPYYRQAEQIALVILFWLILIIYNRLRKYYPFPEPRFNNQHRGSPLLFNHGYIGIF